MGSCTFFYRAKALSTCKTTFKANPPNATKSMKMTNILWLEKYVPMTIFSLLRTPIRGTIPIQSKTILI